MTELQLATGATKWLRSFGLAVVGLLLAGVMAISSFLSAQSAADGSDSEIDYAAVLSATSSANLLGATYSSLPQPTGTNVYSVQAWVNPGSAAATSGSTDRPLINMEHKFAIISRSGKWQYYTGDGSSWAGGLTDTGIAVRQGQWVHVGLAMTATDVHFYLNGQHVHSRGGRTNSGGLNNKYFGIGSWANDMADSANAAFFDGQVDEVRLWQADRGGWMSTDMHVRPTSPTPAAYWDFNQGSGNVVHDRYGSANLAPKSSINFQDVKRTTYVAGGDTVITFPRTYLPGIGGWKIPTNANSFRALVVAGGGGGGGVADGGGGGAGGVVEFQALSVSSTVNIKVGQGGRGGLNVSAVTNHGLNGQTSELGSVVALGGGGGGGYGYPSNYDRAVGYSGGSGGGHSEQDANQAGATGTQATDATTYAGGVEYGNAGGTIIPASQAGSGGGGAGGAGGNASTFRVSGAGGAGMSSSITGTSTFYAAGGGGADRDGTGSNGGSSIGGTGAGPNNTTPTEGTVNTGSGGGGAYSSAGANGGSGVVIVRYSPNKDLAWDKNNTAQSFAFTDSQVIPSSGNFTYEAWYYLDATDVSDGWHALFSQMDTPQAYSQRTSLWLNSGYLHGTYGGTGFSSLYTLKFVQDRWYHIAFVRNGGDAEIYVDGTKVLDEAVTWGAIGGRFTVGGAQQFNEATLQELSGAVDQVKVWGTALDAANIQTSMHTYSTSGVTGTLRAHYDFNEFEDGVVRDRSGNGNHLAFNTAVTGGYLAANVNDAFIIESGTAHSQQSFAKFERSYLTATGGWTKPTSFTQAKALVVAGGGGGGAWVGGGGGAGGFTESQAISISGTVVPVVVGQGGRGAYFNGSFDPAPNSSYVNNGALQAPSNGQLSRIGSLVTVQGGGFGSSHFGGSDANATYYGINATQAEAADGGSGGGASGAASYLVAHRAGGLGLAGQGNAGGAGQDGSWSAAGGGGAGGVGGNGRSTGAGAGGAGKASNITGTSVTLAGGGGGGNHDNYTANGIGNGGGGSGGQFGTSATPNTGGGGGGGAYGGGSDSSGGIGGTGVVVISWGATLNVTRSPVASIPGKAFANPIQIQLTDLSGNRISSTAQVTVTASAGVLQVNGTTLTQSLTVNAVNGIATFTGLGYTSNVSSAQTLVFTSDAAIATSIVVSAGVFPANVIIANGVTTQGIFFEGEFYANSGTGTTNILASDLVSHMASFSTVISASGNINVANDVVTSATASLTLRANGNISLSANVDIQLNSGDLVLWSDSDNNGAGYIRAESGVILNTVAGNTTAITGGGDIYLAGGLDTNADGLPDGYARGAAGINNGDAIQLGSDNAVNAFAAYSGGGDLVFKGDSSRRMAINLLGQMTFKAGNGRLIFEGFSRSTTNADGGNAHAFEHLAVTGNPTLFESYSSHSQAISLVGLSTGTNSDSVGVSFLRGTTTTDVIFSSKGQGGIYVSGRNSQTNAPAMRFQSVIFHAVTSSIVVEARGSGSGNDIAVINFNSDPMIFGATSTLTSSANIVVRADSISNQANVVYSTSGEVAFEPYNGGFEPLLNLGSGFKPSTGVSSLRIGKPGTLSGSSVVNQSTGSVQISAPLSISGTISIYGTSIAISENIQSTRASSTILLRASAEIHVASAKQIRTAGGNIVLWADSDNNSAGYVRLLGNATLCSTAGTCGTTTTGGGDIVIGGGLASTTSPTQPGGAAAGSGTTYNTTGGADTTGVQLGTMGVGSSGAKLYSAGGNIRVYGRMHSSPGAAWAAGIAIVGGTEILSGTGKINLIGETTTAGGSDADGTMEFNAWGGTVNLTSLSTASDAILIEGRQVGSGAAEYGIWGGNEGTSFTAPGGVIIRADHISHGLEATISTSGQIVLEPQGTAFRTSAASTNFVPKFGGDDDLRFAGNPTGLRVGSASNSNTIDIVASSTLNLPTEFIGNGFYISNGVKLTNTAPGADLVFRSKTLIDMADGNSTTFTDIQTNNGDIVMWTNAYDGGSGYFLLGIYAELNTANGVSSKTGSGGGRVTIGGGSAVDADGHPTGPVPGANVAGRLYALWLEDNSKIHTGGGLVDITISSSQAAVAALIEPSSEVWSGTGRIDVTINQGYATHAARMLSNSWISAATASPAISVATRVTGNYYNIYNDATNPFTLASIASTGGGISISAITPTATNTTLFMYGWNMLSRVGSIDISTSGVINWNTDKARALGATVSSDVLSSSANITIRSAQLLDTTANNLSTISTSGSVTIAPIGNNFTGDVQTQFNVFASDFTFGNLATVDSASFTVKVSGDVTANGAITIAGSAVTLDKGYDLISTKAGSEILLKAKQWIDIDNTTTTLTQTNDADFSIIQTNNADIIFWADSDSNQEGLIWVSHNARINSANGVYSYAAVSGGGDIIMAGGKSDGQNRPAGYAYDTGNRNEAAANDVGVGFGKFVDVFTGGGDLIIRAFAKSAALSAFNFQPQGEYITGLGQIRIDARATSAVEAFEYWISTEGEAGALFSSHATVVPAISISASVSATNVQAVRLYNQNSANPTTIQSLATTGGGIAITANQNVVSTTIGSYLAAVNVLSSNGAITYSSNAVMNITNNSFTQNWGAKSGTSVSSSVADVNWIVNGVDGNQNTATISTSGAVNVQPFASTFGSDVEWWADVIDASKLTIGSSSLIASATYDVVINSISTVSGPIEIYANSIPFTAGDHLFSKRAGSKILLKAKTDVNGTNGSGRAFTTHSRIQTNNGDIILWADADGNNSGGIHLGNYFQVNSANGVQTSSAISGGGNIIMAGGTASDAKGYPTGYAAAAAVAADRAVHLDFYTAVYSGGGDVVIRGRTASSFGVVSYGYSEIFTGTGTLEIDAVSTNAGAGRGFSFIDTGYGDSHVGSWDVVSAATRSPAIKIRGVTSGTYEAVRLYGANGTNEITIASTAETGGGVDIYAQSAVGAGIDMYLYRSHVLSRTGAITVSSNVNQLHISGLDYFGSNATSPFVTTSSANVSLIMDLWNFTNTTTYFRTQGDVTIVPKNNNYFGQDAAFGFDTNGIRNLTIGKNPLAADVVRAINLTGAHTVSGNINFFGGTVNVNDDLAVTGSTGRITLKALGAISTIAGVDMRTAGGDVIFWADSDASGVGNIDMEATNTICTGWNSSASTCSLAVGGDIVMGGGAADANDAGLPAGNANGSGTVAATATGLALGPCVSNRTASVNNVFTTRGGNVILRGASSTGNTGTAAVQPGVVICNGTTFNLGVGKMDLSSQFRAVTANYHSALWIAPWITAPNANAVVVNSTNTASDALDIRAWGSNGDYTSYGLTFNNSVGGGALFELDSIWANSAANFNFNSAGPMRIVPVSTSFASPMNLGSNFTLSSTASLFEVGTASNSGQVYISGNKSIAGDITLRASNVSISAALTTTGSGKKITIVSDTISLSANVSATNSSRIEISPRTSGRNIVLGVASISALAIPAAATTFLSATTLQLGSTTSGNISVEASTTFASAKVTNLKLVTPGNVTAVSGAVLTAANLAIDAGGNVNLPGSNSVAGNVAISASASVTYSSAVSYSPGVVDGTNAVFGVGRAISLTNSPTLEQANEFLAVTFNPPPQVLIKDAYNKLLDGNNRLAYQYTASATVASGSGTVTGLTSSSRVGGNITFNAIKVLSGTGTYNFALNVQVDANTTLAVTSANYNIMAGEPGRLIVTATDTASVVGQAGFSFTVSVEDAFGNRIILGDHKNITVSATVSGTTAAITAGRQVRANDDGIATFSDLVVTGSVSDTISVSFTVAYTRLSDNQIVTVSSSVSAITLTHAAAASITLTNSATAKSGIAFTSQPVVRILDAYGNLVTTGEQSTQTVQLSVTPSAMTGTTAISASGGIATFAGIAIEGSTGSKTVTARIYSPITMSDLTIVDLGVGAANKLTLETEGVGAVNDVVLTTQPVLKLRDSANNLVTGVAHNVVASINPAASMSGTTVAINTTTGTATFTALSISGVVGSYSISYAIEGASSSAVASVSQSIELTHGEAKWLRMVSQPTTATAGVTMSPLVVEVTDANGNRVTTGFYSSRSITVFGTYQSAATVIGTKSVSLSAGVATFNNIAATYGAGQNIKVGIEVSGINHVFYSDNIFLSANVGYQLALDSTTAINRTAGQAQTSDYLIRLKDAYGNQTSQSSTISILVTAVSASDGVTVQRTVGSYTISPSSTFVIMPKSAFFVEQSGNYKFSFSSSGLVTAYTIQFTVTNAAADKLVILQNVPSSVQSGITFSPAVRLQLQDAYNNPVLNSTVSVSVSAIAGSVTGISGGVAQNTLGDSIIEFPDLAISGVSSSAQLRFTAASVGTAVNAKTYSSTTFRITSGDPYQLSVSATAVSVANRTSLSTFSVKVLDRAGNLVPNSAAQVRATLTGATLSGNTIVFASEGISTFSSLAVSGTTGTYDLSLASTGLLPSTVSITITHGAANSIDFTSPATSKNALTASSIVAKIFDADGNLVTTGSQSTQNVTLSVSSAVLSGTTTLAASGGIATFSNVAVTGLVGDKNLSAAIASPYAISTSNQITLLFGNAHSLDLTTQAQGFENSEFFATAPSITVRDVSGNAVSASGMVIRVSAATATLSGSVTASAETSIASFASNLKLRGVVGSHTLVFTAEGTSGSGVISTSQQISLTFGAPSQLEISAHPSAARVGLTFTPRPKLRILDDSGNLVSNSSLVVSVAANGADLAGGTTQSAVSGVASYSGLKLVGSASSIVTLSYSINSAGTTISATTSVQLLAGNAVATSLSWTVTDVKTRVAPSYSPVISLFDEFGNKVVSDNSSTAVAKLYRGGTLITQSAVTFTANSGEITFANMALKAEPRSGYYYQFEVIGQSAVTTSDFAVLPGPVAKVVINQEPSSGTAPSLTRTGNALSVQPIIRLLDQDDNLVTTETGTTLSAVIASGSGGSLLSSSASVVNGIATFNQLALVGVVETPTQSAEVYRLKFEYGAFSSSPSAQLSVMHNVADRISIVRDAADGRAGLIFDTTPQVVLLDRFGNRVFRDPAVTIIGNPQVMGGTGSAANVNNNQGVRNTAGVYTFQMGISGLVGNTYEINFYKQAGGVTPAVQSNITITHGISNKIGFLRLPSSTDSNQVRSKTGEALKVQPVIEIQDAAGNRVLDSADVVTATLNLTPRGNRDYLKNFTVSATAGVATFSNLALVVDPSQLYRLNFSYGSNQHTAEVDLQVSHADAEYLAISTSPIAGNKTGDPLVQSPTIVVYDFDGNRTTSLTNVTISASVVVGSGSIESNGLASVINGIADFQNLTLVAPPGENQQLRFTLLGALNSASAAVVSPNSQNLGLTFADPTKLRISQQPSSLAVAAELLGAQPMVRVEDRYGNLVTNYIGSIDVTIAGSGGRLVSGQDATIASVSALVVNGIATYNSLRIEGSPTTTYNLQFASAGLTGTSSNNISVSPAAPASIVMQTQPVGGVTSEALSVQPVAKLLDRFGNLVTNDNSTQVTVALVSGPNRPGGASAVVGGTTTVRVVGGIATFTNLTFTGATNRNYVLGFSAGSFSVNSSAIQVSPAAAATLQWITQPIAQRTGEVMATQPVLRLLDFDGNIATSTSATIVASVSIGGGYIEAGTSSQAVNGIVTFSGLTLVATPSVSQQLTFTATTASGSFAITTATNLVVSHTTASYMVAQSPYVQGGRQGAALATQPKLFLFDRFGNKTIYDSATVVTATIGSGLGGAVSGSNTATAVNGEVQFAGLAATGSPGVNYTLNFAASGGFSLADTTSFSVFKTAEINLSYSPVVYSASKTVSPAILYTDSTEHSISFVVTTPSLCSVNSSSGVVTVIGAGNCVVRASVADGTFYKSNTKDVTLVIAKSPQAPLTITNVDYVDFGQVLPLTAVGGSGTATTRFFASGDCRTIGTSLAFQGNATEDLSPTCSIFAARSGDANHLQVVSEMMDVTVLRIAQQPLAIGNSRATAVGDIELFTVGGSGTGTVSYTITDNGTAQCSLIGTTLRAARNGACEVSAQKVQDVNYNLATSPAITFSFSKQIQQVSFTSALPLMPLAGQTYQAVATASSGLSISYTITLGQEIQASANASYSPAVCSMSSSVSGQVLFLRSGYCEVTATQAGNNVYAANTASQRFEIGRQNQTINFEMLSDKTFGSPSWRLGAQASSGLDVSYTVSAGITACTVTQNGIVTLLAEGKCQIVASQAGNGSWAPAPDVSRLFFVEPDLAGAPSLVSAAVGNQWFTLGYTAPSYLGGSAVQRYRLEVTDVNNNKYVNSACTTTAPLVCTIAGIPNGVAYTARIAPITNAGIGQYSTVTVPLTPSRAEMSVTQLSANVSSGGLDMTWATPVAIDGNFLRYEVYVWVTGTQQPATPTSTITNSTSSTISMAITQIASSSPTIAPAVFVQPQLNVVSSYYRTTSKVFVFGTMQHRPMGFVSLASVQQNAATESATVGYTMKVVTITDTYSSSQTINTANGVKVGLSAPAAPTQLSLDTQDESKIIVSWGAPNSDGGFAIEDYNVQVNGQTICANIQVRMCEVGTVSPGVTYNVSVKARNALGLGVAAVASYTPPAPPSLAVTVTPDPVTPTVPPTVSPTVSPTPTPTPTVTPTPTPTPTITPTPTVKPTPPAPEPSQSTAPEPGPSEPAEESASGSEVIVGPTASPSPEATETPSPEPSPEPSGGDDAVIEQYDPLGSPEAILATIGLLVGAMAAAAAAAAGAAAASSSSSSSGSSSSESEQNDEDLAELEVAHDQIELIDENWGDRLRWFKSRWLTFLDKLTHDLTLLLAPISPLLAKVINDGAYLRALLGSTTLLLPIAGIGLALTAVIQNGGEVFAPTWYLMLAIAVLGLFDAFAGFAATLVFLVGSIIAAGQLPDLSQTRTLMGVMIIAIGPAMLATAFRTLRKEPARDLDSWWERLADLAIAPFMAGWSVMTMVSVMPAISGLTLNMANHVTEFGLAIAIAAALRVLLEEGSARYFPARLNKINPTELPDSPLVQKAVALLIRYGIWVVLSGAIVGFGWQAFVGSALFLLPTVIGWYQDKFPNVPWIWRILPTGVPGLAFTILVASSTSALLAIWLGATPAYAEFSFVLIPLPLLVLSILSMFGREGATPDELRPGKRNRWVYRLGGVAMLLVTLNLTGII